MIDPSLPNVVNVNTLFAVFLTLVDCANISVTNIDEQAKL